MRLGGLRLSFALAALVALATAAPAGAQFPMPQPAVGDAQTHDPSLVVRNGTPRYALFSTHNQVRYSADRTAWVRGPGALDPVPEWTRQYGNGGMWAPDVSYHDGLYWMYYSPSTVGSQHSAIGLATSLTAEPRSWRDEGLVLASSAGDPYNAIDPALLVDDDGRWWLTFGSYWNGIYTIELDPSTGKVKSGASPIHLAKRASGSAIEGAYVFKRNGFYYLFASYGSCCPALISPSRPTYEIRVGRSTSMTGPYVDRNGTAMTGGGSSPVLSQHAHVVGPGGQTVVHDPNTGRDLLVYHWYDSRLNYTSFLGINNLRWDGGWPVVE